MKQHSGCHTVERHVLLPGQTHLDSLTFNLLNQTKTLSAALICYLMLGPMSVSNVVYV